MIKNETSKTAQLYTQVKKMKCGLFLSITFALSSNIIAINNHTSQGACASSSNTCPSTDTNNEQPIIEQPFDNHYTSIHQNNIFPQISEEQLQEILEEYTNIHYMYYSLGNRDQLITLLQTAMPASEYINLLQQAFNTITDPSQRNTITSTLREMSTFNNVIQCCHTIDNPYNVILLLMSALWIQDNREIINNLSSHNLQLLLMLIKKIFMESLIPNNYISDILGNNYPKIIDDPTKTATVLHTIYQYQQTIDIVNILIAEKTKEKSYTEINDIVFYLNSGSHSFYTDFDQININLYQLTLDRLAQINRNELTNQEKSLQLYIGYILHRIMVSFFINLTSNNVQNTWENLISYTIVIANTNITNRALLISTKSLLTQIRTIIQNQPIPPDVTVASIQNIYDLFIQALLNIYPQLNVFQLHENFSSLVYDVATNNEISKEMATQLTYFYNFLKQKTPPSSSDI